MVVVDTNVLSELRKVGAGRADSNVTAWVEQIDAAELFVSSITLMEIELGVVAMERKDSQQGALLRTWMNAQVLPEFEKRTLPVDTAVALRCAKMHVPDRRSYRDSLIAATALVHGMAVATRNVSDFEQMGVPIINPWEPNPSSAKSKSTP